MNRAVIDVEKQKLRDLKLEIEGARQELNKAEAILAAEQAAVNRFRMHARLKIGKQVDEVLSLRSERQSLLIKLRMAEFGDEDDPEWESREAEFPDIEIADDTPEHIILPTDVARDKAAEKRLYRELAKKFHPDLAESGMARAYATTMMAAVNEAYQTGDVGTLRNLAGEPDPSEKIQFEKNASREERKLQKRLHAIYQRIKKVRQQFQAMKRENTARLWRKAKALEEGGLNWWDEVRVELEEESERLRGEIMVLKERVVQP